MSGLGGLSNLGMCRGCHLRQVLMDVKCVGMVRTIAFLLTHKTCVVNLDARFGWPFKFLYVLRNNG
jgi:hypothetical protein